MLRKKCPKMDFFLVCTFSYSVRIQENMDQRKLGIWTLFTQKDCHYSNLTHLMILNRSFFQYMERTVQKINESFN